MQKKSKLLIVKKQEKNRFMVINYEKTVGTLKLTLNI